MSSLDLTVRVDKDPKVSVIIPAYNAMAYLPETLESVLNQTFRDFEVLIINDGSTDSITSWASGIEDSRVRLISQENTGLSGARNKGIAESRGEYVALIDSDDLWQSTKLERQVQYLDNHSDIGLVYTWTMLIDSVGKSTGRVLGSELGGNVLDDLLKRNIIDGVSSVVLRRQCFDKVGMFDITLPSMEDWDMWVRIAGFYEFALIPLPLTLYRQHQSNMSKNWKVMEKAFHQVITKSYDAAPAALQSLKPISLGHAYLVLAWKAVQNKERDYQLARDFQQQALAYNPDIWKTRENLRLTIAIFALKWLGTDGYTSLLSSFYKVRCRLTRTAL